MKTKIRIIAFLLIAAMAAAAVSCGADEPPGQSPDTDREGNPINIPKSIGKIITMGPSNTEILVALGFGDKIIATDAYSENIEGIASGISSFDMLYPDGEQIIALGPDVIFVTGMSKDASGDDQLKVVRDSGICVIYIPSSTSIEEIKGDISFIADVMGARPVGEALIAEMDREIEAIRAVGQTISDRKSIYYEIAAAPWMYSFGTGVFLHEMIEIIGAVNIMEDLEGWVSVADEAILAADPDVILTTVNYIDDPVGEIMSRPGWSGITAVREGEVYYVDTDASNRPTHNIVKALVEMANFVYPDVFKG